MQIIDCFGDFCPLPLLKALKACKLLSEGESFMLVTDHSCTVESIMERFQNTKYHMLVDEVMNGVWEITITYKQNAEEKD